MKRKSTRASQEIDPELPWWRPSRRAASGSEIERMFIAELRTRRARLKQWLRLVELEFIRQTDAVVAKPRRRLKQGSASH
jgi:hypothetical protein